MAMSSRARWFWLLAALSASTARGEVKQVILPAAHVRVPVRAAPRELSSADHAWLRQQLGRTHRRGPSKLGSGERNPAARGAVRSSVALASEATSTYAVIADTDLRPILPTRMTTVVGEPCLAQHGSDVLMTGNWYAAVSTDRGANFHYADPFSAFPEVNGGFCCDQGAAYAAASDLFLWLLLYVPDASGNNTLRLAVARGSAAFEAGDWSYYDVTPQDLGLPAGLSFDYPRLSLGTRSAYVAVNVFDTRDQFSTTVMLRVPLADLAADGSAPADAYMDQTHFTFAAVSGTDTTAYWASQDPSAFAIRLYRWDEGSMTVAYDDLAISAYGAAWTYVCPGPDGRNWCGRSDDRILTGWRAGGILGFMWNASQDGSHAYPYVRVVRIDEGTHSLIDEPDITSSDRACQFPAVAIDARGDLGGVLFVGGGSTFPTVAGLILDDLAPALPSWELHELVAGNRGPDTDEWGDFLCAQAESPQGRTWAVTGFVLRDGGGDADIHPHVLRVGRERDIDCAAGDSCPDDGDACTTDACDATRGCVHVQVSGDAAVTCVFTNGLSLAACGSGVPAAVRRRFERAQQLTERALARSAAARRRVLRRAAAQLEKAQRQVQRMVAHGKITSDCGQALDATLQDAWQRVQSGLAPS
jgi:hypothetical protein